MPSCPGKRLDYSKIERDGKERYKTIVGRDCEGESGLLEIDMGVRRYVGVARVGVNV